MSLMKDVTIALLGYNRDATLSMWRAIKTNDPERLRQALEDRADPNSHIGKSSVLEITALELISKFDRLIRTDPEQITKYIENISALLKYKALPNGLFNEQGEAGDLTIAGTLQRRIKEALAAPMHDSLQMELGKLKNILWKKAKVDPTKRSDIGNEFPHLFYEPEKDYTVPFSVRYERRHNDRESTLRAGSVYAIKKIENNRKQGDLTFGS